MQSALNILMGMGLVLLAVLGLLLLIVVVLVATKTPTVRGGGGYFTGTRGRLASAASTYWNDYWAAIIVPPIILLGVWLLAPFLFPVKYDAYVHWGGPTWELLVAAVLIGLSFAIPHKRLRGFMVGAVGTVFGLAFLISIIYAIGWSPPCAADDTACHERVAATKAAKLAEEVAEAERRTVIAAAEERARATSPSCPGIAETFDLEAGEEKEINPSNCQLRIKLRYGCVTALDDDREVIAEKACSGGGEVKITRVRSVIAVDGPVRIRRIECEPGTKGNLLDRCA